MVELVIVGEAFGEKEEQFAHPFVGPSGQELYQMLVDAGFPLEPISSRFVAPIILRNLWKKSGIPLLNVFMCRPPDPNNKNRVAFFFDKKDRDVDLTIPPYGSGQYVKTEYVHHIHNLHAKLEELKPNLILALGNTAMWAILKMTRISKARGSIHISPFGKVLPCYHPAAILRQWEFRVVTVADLMKARLEMRSPEFNPTPRKIWIEPDLADLDRFWEEHLSRSDLITIDIETERQQTISEVGFAANQFVAIHIPFLVGEKNRRTNRFITCRSYWKTETEELRAWSWVRKVLTSPIPKLFQNGYGYDAYWFARKMGLYVRKLEHDTMLLHHALYPELPKNLGFLGSIYTNEQAWKHLRREGNKIDE